MKVKLLLNNIMLQNEQTMLFKKQVSIWFDWICSPGVAIKLLWSCCIYIIEFWYVQTCRLVFTVTIRLMCFVWYHPITATTFKTWNENNSMFKNKIKQKNQGLNYRIHALLSVHSLYFWWSYVDSRQTSNKFASIWGYLMGRHSWKAGSPLINCLLPFH